MGYYHGILFSPFLVSCSLVHSVTKSLDEHGEKLDDATKKAVQEALDAAKAVDSGASVDVVKVRACLHT